MKSLLMRNAVWLGAIIGAVALPVMQAAEFAFYNKAHDTIVTYAMAGLDFMRPGAWRWFLGGVWLGALSAGAIAGWKQGDFASVRLRARCSLATFFVLMFSVVLNTRGNMKFGWPLFTYTPILFCNAPLQWAVVLAVAGRIAAHRLKDEAKRDG